MTKFRIFAVLFVLLMITPVYAQKIALVDLKEVASQSNELKTKMKDLEALQAKGQKEIDAKEAELAKIQEEMEKTAKMPGVTDEAKAMLYEKAQKKYAEYQKLVLQRQKELADKADPIQKKFVEKVKKIAQTIAVKKGYDIVIPTESALYYNDKFDITKDVVAEINK